MKWNPVYSAAAVLLLTHHVYSFSGQSEPIKKSWQPFSSAQEDLFVTFGAGAQFPERHSITSIANGSEAPEPYDQYSIKNDKSAVMTASAGKRWQRNAFWIPAHSLGIFWQYFFKTDMHGQIIQYASPEFTNYNYHFNLLSNVLLLSGKMNLFQYGRYSPFVHGGIGGAFNYLSHYKETALPDIITRVSPEFRKNTASEFVYNVGAGLDLQFRKKWIFSLSYIFQDLGATSSGTGLTTWSNARFHLANNHTNEILITTTYLFG